MVSILIQKFKMAEFKNTAFNSGAHLGILRGGGGRVQVCGNFHIGHVLISKKKQKKTSEGGVKPPNPPPLDPPLLEL